MTKQIFFSCLAWVVICLVISGIAGWVTGDNIAGWYTPLQKPSFNPPSWIFGPVWTVLYIMIGIAGGLLWTMRDTHPAAFWVYVLQLVFNFAWSFIFFGAHQIGWAYVDILLLWVSIILTIVFAFNASKVAAMLLVPYLGWVTFACVLNFMLWRLNS